MTNIKEQIIDNLKEVYDPEIPVNVYDLGLIYEINVKESGNVNLVMTLTSPTCPTAEFIQTMIEDAIKKVDGVKEVDIEVVFEPIWSPERISEDAKEELGISESSDDNAITQMFPAEKEGVIENICYNCQADSTKLPVFACKYRGEDTFICAKCVNNFN